MFYLTTHSTHFIYGYMERGNPPPPQLAEEEEEKTSMSGSMTNGRRHSVYIGVKRNCRIFILFVNRWCLYLFSCLYPLKVQARCDEHASLLFRLSV